MAKILVTGGSGYIGSHTIVSLIEQGFEVVSVDNFSNSKPEALIGVEKITGRRIQHYNIDLCDMDEYETLFKENRDIEAIIHFAAYKSVEESVRLPLKYFQNNLGGLMNTTELAIKYGVNHFVFSSSCTVYGNPDSLPVSEKTELKPAASPYGRTKQIGEYILQDLANYNKLNVISLRYFNPAGAHHSNEIGESSIVESVNLVPVIMETAIGKRDHCTVFGTDYNTRDGSCVRDYIHVVDLAQAHVRAIEKMLDDNSDQKNYTTYNLGIGQGVTVLEAIQAFEKISDKKLNYQLGPRRPGDVVAIYSDYKKAQSELNWEPQRSIEDIMASAWKWELDKKY